MWSNLFSDELKGDWIELAGWYEESPGKCLLTDPFERPYEGRAEHEIF